MIRKLSMHLRATTDESDWTIGRLTPHNFRKVVMLLAQLDGREYERVTDAVEDVVSLREYVLDLDAEELRDALAEAGVPWKGGGRGDLDYLCLMSENARDVLLQRMSAAVGGG